MTTEEKAKAYDEALEKAKKYHEEYWQVDAKDITETLFPQLIESKDESMMKNIRLALLSVEDAFWRTHGLTAKEAISYIEKQKDFAADEYWRGFKNGRDEVIENPNAFNLQEKQKEQKPAKWSEGDKTMLNNLIWAVHMKSISPLDEMDDRGKYERYEEFLTSLPERFNLQPKQEWSEEDEKVIEEICNIIVSNSKNGYLGRYYAPELVEKLKSLHPSWKPSEEQIQALEYIASSIPPNYLKEQEYAMTLMGRVIQQLKKLLYGSTR